MQCRISGLPAGRPEGCEVDIKLRFDENGIVKGVAVDRRTGKEAKVVYDRSGAAVKAAP